MKTEEIRDLLENHILSGHYNMGDRLNEKSIADEFDVSRTPVREALRLLAASDLIELIPRRGAFVKELSSVAILEMFEVMAELEGVAAKLAADRANEIVLSELETLNAACHGQMKQNSPDLYYFENQKFHFALYEASGNSFLAHEAKKLHRRLQPFRRKQLQVRNRLKQSDAEHNGILSALKRGDAERAREIACQHVRIQGEKMGQLLVSLKR